MSFNKGQLEQIELGIQQGVDVSWYAKECFDWFQMGEIFWGLQQDVDVSVYAKEGFDWWQMRETRLKLLEEKNNVQ